MKRRIPVLLSVATVSASVSVARVSRADNPIIQTKYTADPAPLVYDGTVYLYTSHDEDNAVGFVMYNWMLYTTTDMANWTDHGIVAGVSDPINTFPWAAGNNAWAPQVVERGGKFYLYVPLAGPGGRMTIAVAVADSPFGPFVDAIGGPLVNSGTTEDIDPTVWVDSDGQAYLYWGNPHCYYVTLNEDMVSYSGSVVQIPGIQTYQEGPWFYKHGDLYYLAFASTCCPEGIGYATSSGPTGPWTFGGSIMDGNPLSSGNHPGIIDYKGSSYVFGFNYNVQLQREGQRLGERRSIAVERFEYEADGSIAKLPFWSDEGPDPIEPLDPYVQTEAETIAWAWDVRTEPCDEGGMNVSSIENGDFIKVRGVDFGAGASSFEARVASATNGGTIELHLDDPSGAPVGTCDVPSTGGWQTWVTQTCDVSGASGLHDLYFVFSGDSGSLLNFNWWRFVGSGTGGSGGEGGGAGTGASGAAGASGAVATGGATSAGGGAPTGGLGGAEVGGSGGLPVGSGGAAMGGTSGVSALGGVGGATAGSGGAPVGGGGGLGGTASGGLGVTGAAPGAGGLGGAASTGGAGSPAGASGGTPAAGGDAPAATASASDDPSGCSCGLARSPDSASGWGGLLVGLGLSLSRVVRRRRTERGAPGRSPRSRRQEGRG